MKNILLTIMVLLCGFSYPAIAQTETKRNFTLTEAQNYALENSYSVRGTDYDLKVARKKVWETIADGLPQIDASANYNNNLNVAVSLLPSEFFGGEPGTYTPIQFGQKYSSSASISVSQKIFDGSYIVGTMAAKVYVQLSKDQKEKSEIEIRDAVAQAFYTVLVAEENYKTIKENLEITNSLLRETDAYFQNGFREELDVDQIRLMMKTTQNQLADAERAIRSSRIVLKFAMGYDIDQDIELSNNLADLVNPVRVENPVIASYDVSNHIDFRIIETQLKAQKLIMRNEQAEYLPKVSAFYNYGKNTSSNSSNVFQSDVPWFKSSVIGFQVSMPIFSSFKRNSKVKQEKINYMKLENTQLMTEQNLKKDLTLAFSNLINAKAKYENGLEGLEIAKRIYDKTRIKFNEGISTSTELSENEKQYLDTHSAYINATLELLNSKIAFEKALGKL